MIAQIFAQALGVVVHDIHLLGPDTDITPDAGKTSASRQTFVSGNAARLSGESLRRKVLALANAGPDASFSFDSGTVTICDGAGPHVVALQRLPVGADGYVLEAIETYDPPTLPLDENGQGVPYAQFGYAAHLAVVEVDVRLGSVIPQRFTAAHDVGQAINPLLVEGQVKGGSAPGLGVAWVEDCVTGGTVYLHGSVTPTYG